MSGQGTHMPGRAARDLQGTESLAEGTAPAPQAPAADPTEPGHDGFDDWLRTELSRLYDTPLADPAGEDMARLLAEAAAKGRSRRQAG